MKHLLAPILVVALALVVWAAAFQSGTTTVEVTPTDPIAGQEATIDITVTGANDTIINYEVWLEGDQYAHGTLKKRVEGVNDTGITDSITHTYTTTSLSRNGAEWPHDTVWIKFETTTYGDLWEAHGEFTVGEEATEVPRSNWRMFAPWGTLPPAIVRLHG